MWLLNPVSAHLSIHHMFIYLLAGVNSWFIKWVCWCVFNINLQLISVYCCCCYKLVGIVGRQKPKLWSERPARMAADRWPLCRDICLCWLAVCVCFCRVGSFGARALLSILVCPSHRARRRAAAVAFARLVDDDGEEGEECVLAARRSQALSAGRHWGVTCWSFSYIL